MHRSSYTRGKNCDGYDISILDAGYLGSCLCSVLIVVMKKRRHLAMCEISTVIFSAFSVRVDSRYSVRGHVT